ncbi:MAG: hypothetical protein HOV79_33360 [Hamadaea sp.]|nr:hypothetical protein [Hamadaea sp.]
MPRMKRGVRLFGRRRDAGGVAVIVGILLASGVLLGMTALVVDVGQLYAEREELQSGADGVATAVALDCVKRNVTKCDEPGATATKYANANAKDSLTRVVTVCGDAVLPGMSTSLLDACSGSYPDNLTNCIGSLPPNTRGYVEARTATERNASGADRFLLPPSFAQAVVGGYSGTAVGACSRVAWGSPRTGIAITFCTAEYLTATSNGLNFAPPPPATPDESYERKLVTQAGNGNGNGNGNNYSGPCSSGPSGWDVPGDFGFTDPMNADSCETLLDQVYYPKPGNGAPNVQTCRDFFEYVRLNRIAVGIPIFKLATGSGNQGQYELEGIAAFVITGYSLANLGDVPSTLTGDSCANNEKCLLGYFTNAVTPLAEWDGQFGSAPSFGATVVKTVG